MREEPPALTTWQSIGLIMATPGNDSNGAAFLDEGDMAEIARLLDEYKAERDAERDALRAKLLDALSDSEMQRLQAAAERDAARREVVALRSTLRSVLDILKSGRSTGRTAIKALFAAEDVIEGALATAE